MMKLKILLYDLHVDVMLVMLKMLKSGNFGSNIYLLFDYHTSLCLDEVSFIFLEIRINWVIN